MNSFAICVALQTTNSLNDDCPRFQDENCPALAQVAISSHSTYSRFTYIRSNFLVKRLLAHKTADKKLTSKMSATIDQLRLRATSPTKTSAKPRRTSLRARKNATKMNTDDRTRPRPQISGSDRGYFSRRRVLRIAPSGTPIIPDIMVTAPNIKDTLYPDIRQRQKTAH